MEKVSIIIPAHNEEKRIGKTLKDYIDFFGKLKKQGRLDYEIVIVLNACKDDTLEIVKKFPVRILNFKRGGKGFAITEGFKDALKGDNDYLGFIDADDATPAAAFYDLVKNIKNFDGVIANRWDKKSKITKQTFSRRIISRGFNFIIRSLFLLPYRDTQCGAKLFRKELIEKIISKLGSTEWSYDVDLLFYARRESAKIKSIPTVWNDIEGSKVNLRKTPARMFFSVLRLRLVHSPFRFIVKAYSHFPEKLRVYHWLS